jgi:hypothetical protein
MTKADGPPSGAAAETGLLLTGVLAALAIAGPISGAGAAAPADPCGSQVAVGPTLVDTVFSGPTTIVTSTSPPACVV